MPYKQEDRLPYQDYLVQGRSAQRLVTKNINAEFEQKLTIGEKFADKVAEFGGSWTFIISFGALLILWVITNSVELIWRPFDPYPFIFLNLILSCLAAIQAPVIMMSQNRQEEKDRLRAELDYQINLKAELEIQQLNQKIEQLIQVEWKKISEALQAQNEILEEIRLQQQGNNTRGNNCD